MSSQSEPGDKLLSSATTEAIGPEHPLSIVSRIRELAIDGQDDLEATIELVEYAKRFGSGVDIETERTLSAIVFAGLVKLFEHVLANPKQIAVAYDLPLKRGRPNSNKKGQNEKRIAQEIVQHMEEGDSLKEAKDKAAGIIRDVRTVDRAYKKHGFIAGLEKTMERKYPRKK